jgi:hypothetical protein
MRPLILVLIPIVLFAGALLTADDSKPAEKNIPEPYQVIETQNQQNPQTVEIPDPQPETSKPPAPATIPSPQPEPSPASISVRKCTNAAGTFAYETEAGLQVKIESERAQCDNPVAIVKDGKKYFGCPSGKIILDCDWFVETEGQETATKSAVFGNSYVVDFKVPDTSGMSCTEELIDPAELAVIGGNICDLERLVGNLNHMHGG